MSKIKLGITIGDINGIGPEVIIKAVSTPKILEICTPIIYGSSKVIAYYKNIVNESSFSFSNISTPERADSKRVNVITVSQEDTKIEMGKSSMESGSFALKSIDRAISDAQNGLIQAIVTGPINKKSMEMAGFKSVGHTEHLSEAFNVKNNLMLMVCDDLRIATLTNHIPISKVAGSLTSELLLSKIKVFNKSLIQDFGLEKPLIAVLGLNPHASDDGLIGDEEEKIIRPTIIEAKKNNGILVSGPYPADGFFSSGNFKKVDGILSMYHDQGLIPFKLLSGDNGVNFTAGLPVVRTSPDHGTAFDLAGKNEANAGSMMSAIFEAVNIYKERKLYKSDNSNPLRKKNIKDEDPDAKDEVIIEEK